MQSGELRHADHAGLRFPDMSSHQGSVARADARSIFTKIVLRRWKLWLGVIGVATVLILARHVPLADWLDRMVDPLRSLGAWGVLLYAVVYFVVAMCCLPTMPLTLAAGYIFGTWKGVLAVHSACTLAAACGFLVGRQAGRRRAADWLKRSPRFHFLERAIEMEGWKIVGLLRMHPLPFGLSNYLYGMIALDFWHYLIATSLAMLPGHLIYVHLGSLGEKHLTGDAHFSGFQLIAPVLGIVSMLVLTVVFTRIVRRHRKQTPKV